MKPTLDLAIAAFGAAAKEKLANPAVTGQPEDQLRAPFERLLADLAQLLNFSKSAVAAVGESSVSDLKTRPDYAVTVHNALVGFIELKAPGKGADPRKFKDSHDKAQWDKLHSLPNLIYTDGNAFSLWQNGEIVGSVVKMEGDVELSGTALKAPIGLLNLFESFLHWQPIPPSNAKALAETTARLCRLLREEVTEQLALKSEVLTGLAQDWRKLLFPDASDERFADGYAQAVTFGMLMARAKNITLATGLQQVASELSKSSTLVGAALKLLTDDAQSQATLKTSLGTLTRVLDAVNWSKISRNKPDAWLYFYEDFLEVYDNQLRKQTGSYYTPPEVVGAMVELADEALRSRFGLHAGMAAPSVTLADPAVGTGTFLLGVLRKIAETVKADEGEGAVKAAVNGAVKRLIAFEMQLGPFAVAQLRILAEIVDLTGGTPKTPLRMFVTDTLGNPDDDEGYFPQIVAAIANARKEANKIKREEPITVVIGNPPYKEKSKGLGGWVEGENSKAEKTSPLAVWTPPPEWGAGAHSRHLRNLYIYFWRWATWKVYDHGPGNKNGIICFITAAGFLAGSGFQKMRDYLRRSCNDIWVIDCSPEGHRPDVNTRIFQGVQQPICIVLASRSDKASGTTPARVLFHMLPAGHRTIKFEALSKLGLEGPQWIECSTEWRSPFLPSSTSVWVSYPKLDELFVYNGTGVMVGRTWIIAPDSDSLIRRWKALVAAPAANKEVLFHPHLREGELGDKHSKKLVTKGLGSFEMRLVSVADDTGPVVRPIPYGFRSLDRQWIIPDSRLINQPNPELWETFSSRQIYITAPSDKSPTAGPALTVCSLIPDVHHYNGRGGRAFPLWRTPDASEYNVRPELTEFLARTYEIPVTGECLFSYIVAIAANPAYTSRFQNDLSTPGLRIPLTAESQIFVEACELGRRIIWLHTFGERMADPENGRPTQPPRLPSDRRPNIPRGGEIPQETMPDSIDYDASKRRLILGAGYIENVDAKVWEYEVSGKQVLLQWFSYRKANRERPIIGDRRKPSPLGDVQPDHWLPEYTTELLNVLNVLGLLLDLEPAQAKLLDEVCSGKVITATELQSLETPGATAAKARRRLRKPKGTPLF